MSRSKSQRTATLIAVATASLTLLSACGGDDSTDGAATTTGATASGAVSASSTPASVTVGSTPATTETGSAATPAPSGTLPEGRISIATGGTSGVYFVYGGGIATLVSKNLKGVEATAEVTSASVDNIKLVGKGDSDIAFTLADTASDAVAGKGPFSSGPVAIQAVARLYDNFTQVVVKADSSVAKTADLKGKRVSVGAPNSGTEVIALRMLEASGLDPAKDVKKQQLGIAESVQGLRDGTIDAFFWSGGLPTGGLTDLASTTKIKLLPTVDLLEPMKAKYGDFYSEGTIPAATYKTGADVATIAVPNYLVVADKANDELVYQLTKMMFEKQADLAAVHPEAKKLSLEVAPNVAPLEVHPGAQRYYAEAKK